jgi:hypothetical protein
MEPINRDNPNTWLNCSDGCHGNSGGDSGMAVISVVKGEDTVYIGLDEFLYLIKIIIKTLVLTSKKIDHISITYVRRLLMFMVKLIRLTHSRNQTKSISRSTLCGRNGLF